MQRNWQGGRSRLHLCRDRHFSCKFSYPRLCCCPPSLLCLSCPLGWGWPGGSAMFLRGSGALAGFRGWGAPRPWLPTRGEPRPRLPAGRRVPARAGSSWLNKLPGRCPRGPACRERKRCQSMHTVCTVRNLITDGAAQGFDGSLSLVSDSSGSCKGPGRLPAASARFSVSTQIKGGCLSILIHSVSLGCFKF